jgi:mannosyltransferase
MKVCFITTGESVASLKGIGRYANEIIERLENVIETEVITTGRKKRINSFVYLPFKIMKSKSDLYHALVPDVATTLVMLKKNTIVTFHDLIPYYAWKTNIFKWKIKVAAKLWSSLILKNVAKKCKLIITPSKQTAEELQDAFGIQKEKIKVIPEGVSDFFRPLNLERKYILFFSNFSYRKRVDIAINAYKKFCEMVDNPPKLVIAGGYTRSAFQQQLPVEKLIELIKDKVIIKNKVSDEEVLKLYNQSYFLLFTSDYEGFGLPILEAARCKTIPIVRKEAKIPEEVKSNGIVTETEKIAEIMYELYVNKNKRKILADRFYKKSLNYNWEKTIKQTLKVYEEVMEQK